MAKKPSDICWGSPKAEELGSEIIDAIRPLAQKATSETAEKWYTSVRVLVDLFAKGQSVPASQIASVLDSTPRCANFSNETVNLHVFIVEFLQAMQKISDPKAIAKKEALSSWQTLLTTWPTSGESGKVNLDSQVVSDRVNAIVADLRDSLESNTSKGLAALQTHVEAAELFLTSMDVDDEKGFRSCLRKNGAEVGKTHSSLTEALGALKHGVLDASGRNIVANAEAVAGRLLYHVTVYTALTLYRNSGTWTPNATGAAQKSRLKLCLSQLDANPSVLAAEVHYRHRLVQDMCRDLGIPEPAVAPTSPKVAKEVAGASGQVVKVSESVVPDAADQTQPAAAPMAASGASGAKAAGEQDTLAPALAAPASPDSDSPAGKDDGAELAPAPQEAIAHAAQASGQVEDSFIEDAQPAAAPGSSALASAPEDNAATADTQPDTHLETPEDHKHRKASVPILQAYFLEFLVS